MSDFGYRVGPNDGMVRPFDDRSLDELRAREQQLAAKLADEQVLVEYAAIKYGTWNPANGPYRGPSVDMARETAASVGRDLAWVRQTIRIRELEAADARRREIYVEQARNIERELGIEPRPASPTTLAEAREVRWQQEQAAFAARPKPTREQLDRMDPNTKIGKQLAREELDRLDVSLQAKLTGQPVVDAIDVIMGRVDPARDRMTSQPGPVAPVKAERRSFLATIRTRIAGH